jgi:phosphatidyl-myo-inositol alpha-mannosyltransferase
MRIAIVCPYDLGVHGGVQDQTTRLVKWLGAAGHQARLIGPGETGPEGSVLLGRTSRVRINRSTAPIGLGPGAVVALRRATADADVIHVHEPFVPAVGMAALKVGMGAKVATFHADPSRAVRGVYSLGRSVARIMLSQATVLTAVSATAASALRRVRPVRIVPNGIDVAEYGAGDKQPGRVVFVGRDDPRKGLAVLLDAWPAVLAAAPNAELHLVGVERDVAVPSVVVHGLVAEEEKRAVLAGAEVHVAPNTGGESFGVVVLEGMASRCAVVASGIPAFAAVLAGAGELVPPNDPAGLAAAIVRLLGDPERRAALADAAHRRAMDFDGSVVAAGYAAAYEEAVALAV